MIDLTPNRTYPTCAMGTDNISKRTNIPDPDPIADLVDIPRPVVAMAKQFLPGHVIPFHQHARSQLLYASSGVMTVTTQSGIWVVPPLRGMWIPAGTLHQINVSGHLSMRTLYIEPAAVPAQAPEGCCVVAITLLMKALILHAITLPRCYPLGGPEERIMTVILDQIHQMNISPLKLPIPKDPRLKRIYKRLSQTPGDNRRLEEWGRLVGATARTLARHFRLETGMSFGQWRQQIRILEALRRLGMDEPVTAVAIDLGYDSPSAFIAMFRKALGKTPGQYFGG